MAQLKPAAKILIGALVIAPLGYFGSKYLDKVPAPQPQAEQAIAQPAQQEVHAPQTAAAPTQQEEAPQPVEVQQPTTQSPANAGIGALLNSGKK